MADKQEKKAPTDFRMSFTGHLEELRKRLLYSAIALVVGMGVSYAMRDHLFAFILHPLFVARQTVDGEMPGNQTETATAAELAEKARRFSKQALEADEARDAARLAAKAASLAAKAAEAADRTDAQREARERERRQRSIAYTNPMKPFWVSLQLSLVGGICLAFGFILWQVWAFVAPGLYPGEKRYALPFIVAGTGCFLGGAGFGYRFVFPMAFGFLTRFSREIAVAQGIDMMDVTTVDAFVGIALKLLLAFGLVFELPVVVSFLALAGIVDHKQLWRFGRWFVVISVIVGALLTPPDIISQVMMAVPLSVLYLISIGLAYILHPARRRRKKEEDEEEEEAEADEQEETAAEATDDDESDEAKSDD